MKCNFLLPVLGALMFTVSGFAEEVKAEIPFDFHAGKALLPAGTYTVRMGEPSGTVMVRSAEGTGAAIVITNALFPGKDKSCRLVFHKYGNIHYLNQVWGVGGGRELIPTAAERETALAAAKRARVEVAGNIKK